ncbi:hypothetical protein TKK_0009764 [Trichogramma kaykai]
MESHKTAISLLQEDYFMASIDIKDAFYSVPIHESHRKYLRFQYENKLYEFNCLVFGLNVAPYFFTKLLKPVVSFLRKLGILLIVYIDDILLIAKRPEDCAAANNVTTNLLQNLGFLLNDKGSKIPSTRCVYLGF